MVIGQWAWVLSIRGFILRRRRKCHENSLRRMDCVGSYRRAESSCTSVYVLCQACVMCVNFLGVIRCIEMGEINIGFMAWWSIF